MTLASRSPIAPRSLIMGIDPGITGAFALYDPKAKTLVGTYAMPTVRKGPTKAHSGRNGYKVDPVGVGELLQKLAPLTMIAVIELVGSRPGQGSVSTFTFGFGTGIVHGALAAYRVPLYLVRPEVWKAVTGVTKDKATALKHATKLFPGFERAWPNNAASGHAEAAILAHFGTRYVGEKPDEREDGKQLSEFAKDLLG